MWFDKLLEPLEEKLSHPCSEFGCVIGLQGNLQKKEEVKITRASSVEKPPWLVMETKTAWMVFL